jgi:hypothetical protein
VLVRAMHAATVAVQDIAAAFYAEAPSWSYDACCSTSGRRAMFEAQVCPGDLDAILADDLVINQSELDGLLSPYSTPLECFSTRGTKQLGTWLPRRSPTPREPCTYGPTLTTLSVSFDGVVPGS